MAAHNVAAHSAHLSPGAGHQERPQGCATHAAQARWLAVQHVARQKLLGRAPAAPIALAGQQQQRRAGHAGPTPCKQSTPQGKAGVERLIACCWVVSKRVTLSHIAHLRTPTESGTSHNQPGCLLAAISRSPWSAGAAIVQEEVLQQVAKGRHGRQSRSTAIAASPLWQRQQLQQALQ